MTTKTTLVFDTPFFLFNVPSLLANAPRADRDLLAPFTASLQNVLTAPCSVVQRQLRQQQETPAPPPPSSSTFDLVVFSNFQYDPAYMFRVIPRSFWLQPGRQFLWLVHDESWRNSIATAVTESLLQHDSDILKRMTFHIPSKPYQYGTHHTKAVFLFGPHFCRIVIGTGNYHIDDMERKSQFLYAQDFPAVAAPPPPCKYQLDLITYLTATVATKFTGPQNLATFPTRLRAYDFSSAEHLAIISSVPGYHQGQQLLDRHGQNAIAKTLRDNNAQHQQQHQQQRQQQQVTASPPVKSRSVTAQYTSGGSLQGANFVNSLWASLSAPYEFSSTAQDKQQPQQQQLKVIGGAARRQRAGDGEGDQQAANNNKNNNRRVPVSTVKVILPTVEEVRNCIEGWRAAHSMPIAAANHTTHISSLLHRWTPSHQQIGRGRGWHRAMPHAKSYLRLVEYEDEEEEDDPKPTAATARPHNVCKLTGRSAAAEMLFITSMNLSKSAFGERQLNGKQLFIRSYELGVLLDAAVQPQVPQIAANTATPPAWNLNTSRRCISLEQARHMSLFWGIHFVPLAGQNNVTVVHSIDGNETEIFMRCVLLPYDPVNAQRYVPGTDTVWTTDVAGLDPIREIDANGMPLALNEGYSHFGDMAAKAPLVQF